MGIFGRGQIAWDPAFEEFAARRTDSLVRTAFFLIGDQHAAEDVVQTALVRTAMHWRAARASPDAYIRQVVVNLVRDGWRSGRRRPREVPLQTGDAEIDRSVSDRLLGHDPVSQPAETLIADRDELLGALRQLPERQRAAVVLRYWDELSVSETAAAMGCTEGTVKSASSRGLVRLRQLLTAEPAGLSATQISAAPGRTS
jgi:RNA polymerase sigma-70 factor (sigma-E family)